MPEFAAVTFDMWETVLTDAAGLAPQRDELRIAGMAQVTGLDPAKVRAGFEALRRHMARVQAVEGDLGLEDQLGWILGVANGPALGEMSAADREAFEQAYVEPLFTHAPVLMPGVDTLLAGLAERGVRVGLICNTGFTPGTALRRYLAQHGLHDHFAAMHFSCETGFAKPHRRAFTDTLKALGVTPAETIHIGDNPATDVAGAKRVGMRAALLHRAATPPAPGHAADVVVTTLAEFATYLGH